MSDLSAFLPARITEDEEAARRAFCDAPAYGVNPAEADDGVWSQGTHGSDECKVEGVGILIYDEGGHTPEQARHIARHDPARVLAECDAKRRIIGRHPEMLGWCQGCAHASWPCDTLRLLAVPYADHPDYDETWRP